MTDLLENNNAILNCLAFGPMLITDVFNIHNGSGAARENVGAVPYVAASFQNNGVVGYVDRAKYPGGWLSLVKDGDGGAGKCFYQPVPFWPSNHVLGLEPKFSGISPGALLCLAAIITHQCFPKYSRGNPINATRLNRQKIMVPVKTTAREELGIDWDGLTRLGDAIVSAIAEQADRAVRSIHGSSTRTAAQDA